MSLKKFLPAGVVASLITAGGIMIPLQASAVTLPQVSADELVEMMNPDVTGFSGTVVKTTDLGLPALEMSSMMSPEMVDEMAEKMPDGFEDFIPQIIEQNLFTEAIAFVAGSDTIRVFASEEGFRAQILDPLGQRDIIVTEGEFWAYDSRTQTVTTRATDYRVDDADVDAALEAAIEKLSVDLTDPRAVAERVLDEAGADTAIRVGDDHRIAGRTAYRLIIEPTSAVSLVSSIQISVDSENGMPLGVRVFSVELQRPAAEIAFTQVSFDVPDAALFSFTPPPGATVEALKFPESIEQAIAEVEAGVSDEDQVQARAEALADEFAPGSTITQLGERWETVVAISQLPQQLPIEMLEMELFQDLLIQVTGGQVFSTPLANVLMTDDGRVFAGAVTIEHLLTLAAG
jgi:outer membrane lipoprotein-sorting protein